MQVGASGSESLGHEDYVGFEFPYVLDGLLKCQEVIGHVFRLWAAPGDVREYFLSHLLEGAAQLRPGRVKGFGGVEGVLCQIGTECCQTLEEALPK